MTDCDEYYTYSDYGISPWSEANHSFEYEELVTSLPSLSNTSVILPMRTDEFIKNHSVKRLRSGNLLEWDNHLIKVGDIQRELMVLNDLSKMGLNNFNSREVTTFRLEDNVIMGVKLIETSFCHDCNVIPCNCMKVYFTILSDQLTRLKSLDKQHCDIFIRNISSGGILLDYELTHNIGESWNADVKPNFTRYLEYIDDDHDSRMLEIIKMIFCGLDLRQSMSNLGQIHSIIMIDISLIIQNNLMASLHLEKNGRCISQSTKRRYMQAYSDMINYQSIILENERKLNSNNVDDCVMLIPIFDYYYNDV
jgi:hypothetical protein